MSCITFLADKQSEWLDPNLIQMFDFEKLKPAAVEWDLNWSTTVSAAMSNPWHLIDMCNILFHVSVWCTCQHNKARHSFHERLLKRTTAYASLEQFHWSQSFNLVQYSYTHSAKVQVIKTKLVQIHFYFDIKIGASLLSSTSGKSTGLTFIFSICIL